LKVARPVILTQANCLSANTSNLAGGASIFKYASFSPGGVDSGRATGQRPRGFVRANDFHQRVL
jgi:hypothetical protein